MLEIEVKVSESYDEKNQKFVYEHRTLRLEHSLYSISLWETKWRKPFLKDGYKLTGEEALDYIRCMVLHKEEEYLVYILSEEQVSQIGDYILASMTATTVSHNGASPRNRKVVTSEVLYSRMILMGIPFECQYWHLSRLLMLMQVIDVEANPKKMSKRDTIARHKALNAARKQKLKSKG